MKKLKATIFMVTLIGCLTLGITMWKGIDKVNAAPKNKIPLPLVFSPATVKAGEIVRVSVFNTTNQTVYCVVETVDVVSGQIQNDDTELILSPKTGQLVDLPETDDTNIIIVIRSFFDIEYGVVAPAPIGSVQISDPTVWNIRFIPPWLPNFSFGVERE